MIMEKMWLLHHFFNPKIGKCLNSDKTRIADDRTLLVAISCNDKNMCSRIRKGHRQRMWYKQTLQSEHTTNNAHVPGPNLVHVVQFSLWEDLPVSGSIRITLPPSMQATQSFPSASMHIPSGICSSFSSLYTVLRQAARWNSEVSIGCGGLAQTHYNASI